MPRNTFEQQIKKLKEEVLELGSMVEDAVWKSLKTLEKQDVETARQVYLDDQMINTKRFNIEENTLILIATQQPMARDLRALAGVLEIITDLERMGDYAKGIAKITIMNGETPLLKPLIDIPRMVEVGVDMLHQALEAFMKQDVKAARQIPRLDDTVDDLYQEVYRELITIIVRDNTSIERANNLMWAAHNMERFADRVINICERIVFMETGDMMEMDIDYDEKLLESDESVL